MEITQKQMKSLAEALALTIDGKAIDHPQFGWIVQLPSGDLVDPFSTEILEDN